MALNHNIYVWHDLHNSKSNKIILFTLLQGMSSYLDYPLEINHRSTISGTANETDAKLLLLIKRAALVNCNFTIVI